MAAMEDVLDLYEEPYDPQYPTVCAGRRNRSSCMLMSTLLFRFSQGNQNEWITNTSGKARAISS